MALRCAIVDDKPEFLEAARNLLERQGIAVGGLVSRAADAVDRVQELAPYDEDDFAELMADSPAAGFLSKSALSRRAISDLLDGR